MTILYITAFVLLLLWIAFNIYVSVKYFVFEGFPCMRSEDTFSTDWFFSLSNWSYEKCRMMSAFIRMTIPIFFMLRYIKRLDKKLERRVNDI